MDHIPKGALAECSNCLARLIGKITAQPLQLESWYDLFAFAPVILAKAPRGGKRANITKLVKSRVAEFKGFSKPVQTKSIRSGPRKAPKDPDVTLATLVSSKLEQGDFRGAVRLVCSSDAVAEPSSQTILALKDKHPPAVGHRVVPPSLPQSVVISSADVKAAIKTFPKGSAGGIDGLKPQHLKDLISDLPTAEFLLMALTEFVNLLLAGICPVEVRPLLFGGNLTALSKKDGGIRPIAVGSVLRRVVAKCDTTFASQELKDTLAPRQLGVGVSGGAEAAVHAARRFVKSMDTDEILIKLDFKNAFNTLRRDAILQSVYDQVPEIYNFCHLAYGQPSHLNFKGVTITSEEGCQQGDPLGPLLFSITINPILQSLTSELILGYLDDLTVGGKLSTVIDDYGRVQTMASDLGLQLNEMKCEVVGFNSTTCALPQVFGKFISVEPSRGELLGAALFAGPRLDELLDLKVGDLKRASDRLRLLHSHDALLILKNALCAPKLLYLLRCSPCFGNTRLSDFDTALRASLSVITNCDIDDAAWIQASLPVGDGGLGIRSVAALAPSAFLASAASTRLLQTSLLPTRSPGSDIEVDQALALWSSRGHQGAAPSGPEEGLQSSWDRPWIVLKREDLATLAGSDPYHRARLLACPDKISGAWLEALPISACGLRLDDNAVRIAVGIRLGINLCTPHVCQCGQTVDARGTHGLACRKNVARQPRHALLNDLVHRSLTKAGFPSNKEPAGLLRDDGKRPDGCTLIPWQSGKCLTWDVTAPDTLASSHLASTSTMAGAAAESAARLKVAKYSGLTRTHHFVPIAIESLGPCNAAGVDFFKEVGHCMSILSGDPRETSFLFQRVSIINQRFNAVAVSGCFQDPSADLT